MKILETSYENGINLIDTADIYNGGNSELAIGKFIAQHKNHFLCLIDVAIGLKPHTVQGIYRLKYGTVY